MYMKGTETIKSTTSAFYQFKCIPVIYIILGSGPDSMLCSGYRLCSTCAGFPQALWSCPSPEKQA